MNLSHLSYRFQVRQPWRLPARWGVMLHPFELFSESMECWLTSLYLCNSCKNPPAKSTGHLHAVLQDMVWRQKSWPQKMDHWNNDNLRMSINIYIYIYTYVFISLKSGCFFGWCVLHLYNQIIPNQSVCFHPPVRVFLTNKTQTPPAACISIRVGIWASPLEVKQRALLHRKFWWNKVILHRWIDLDDIATATTWKMPKRNVMGWMCCSPYPFPVAVVFCWNWCLVKNPWETFRPDTDIVIDDAVSVRNSCGPFLNLSVNGSKSTSWGPYITTFWHVYCSEGKTSHKTSRTCIEHLHFMVSFSKASMVDHHN